MFKKLFLVSLFLICSLATAGKMSYTLQEALYTFEMKGESSRAIKLLEQVIEQGDPDDVADATFYLGKINELSGNKDAASAYYRQSIKHSTEPAKIYWLSERDAVTNGKGEKLLEKKISLPAPIKKIFPGQPTYVLLQNGSIHKLEADSLVRQHQSFSSETNVISIDKKGIWYQPETKDSLIFRSLGKKNYSHAYPIKSALEILSSEENTLVQGVRSLFILNKKGILHQINDKYKDCHIEDFFSISGNFILNCPDNALHFISETSGNESYTISQMDVIQQILIMGNDILVLAGNILFCYQPQKTLIPRWKVQFSNAEKILAFGKNVAILEASGKVSLLDTYSGVLLASYRSDASNIQPLAIGTLGLFTSEGALTAVDTLLRPIWHFNFASQITGDIIHSDGLIYLPIDDRNLQGISSHYYGKKPLLSNIVANLAAEKAESNNWNEVPALLDSVFKLEPGNAGAWLFKALYLENSKGSDKDKQKAWSEAVRLSISNPQATPIILNKYGKTIGAKFVNLLRISPKFKYPQLFGNKKNLFTIDPAAEKLVCLNPETGDLRWTRSLSKMDNSPVMGNDENTLVIVSGFNLQIYDLNREATPTTLPLPGKAFNVQLTGEAIYVTTWNGFLMKIMRSDNRQAWSRKIFSSPLLFTRDHDVLHLASLDGEIMHLWDESGQIKSNGPKLQNNISFLTMADSTLVIATSSNRIYLYGVQESTKDPVQILMEAPVVSLQSVHNHGKDLILVGLSNQELLLYSPNGAPLWKYKGKGSLFNAPYIHEEIAWIDQGSEVIGLSLKDGSIQKKFDAPGGAGTPFIMNRTLYSASSKRLLYGFSL